MYTPVIVATALSLLATARLAFGAPVAPERRTRVLVAVMLLSALPLLGGGLAYLLAMRAAFDAVASADPSTKASSLSAGMREAVDAMIAGVGAFGVSFVLALGAMVRARGANEGSASGGG